MTQVLHGTRILPVLESRPSGGLAPRTKEALARTSAVLPALVVAMIAQGAWAEEVGPRSPRLTDFTPRNLLVVGGEFGRMGEASGLALPVSARVQISPELVLEVDVPFGYLNAPGEIVDPMVGNLGVGVLGSASDRLGPRGQVRWGLRISGRVPTSPGIEDGRRAFRVARLRAITPQASERWSPGAAAVRIDVGVSYGAGDLGVHLQAAAIASLPMGEGPATAHGLYGAMVGYRIFQALWGQLEILGTQTAPGATETSAGHFITAAAGIRIQMMRVTPVIFVSVPVLGDVEGDRPVVIGIEVASW